MLIIEAYVNHTRIDTVWVQNVGHIGGDERLYKIRKPEGDWPTISHARSDGWRKLAVKALKVLEDEKGGK